MNTSPKSNKRQIKSFAVTTRWIHVYLSSLGLLALLFFAITGITLNHPDFFYSGEERIREFEGTIPLKWLGAENSDEDQDPTEGVDKLAIVERLRNSHNIRGAVSEFSGDDYELVIGFAGPGYAADAFIEREDGSYNLTETSHGAIAIMNDLHKGRDSGKTWSWVIDITGAIMILASLSGFYLVLTFKKRKRSALLACAIGATVFVIIYLLWVP